jgi:hypothetical protein
MGKITASVGYTCSGIFALLKNVNTPIMNVWLKVVFNPMDKPLVVLFTPFNGILERFRGQIQRAEWEH